MHSLAALWQIRSMRRALAQHTVLTLILALVISKVDYCATVLVGISGLPLDRLQSVLNAAAWLIYSARCSDLISRLLYKLHWLWIPERIKFRLCLLTFCCLHGTAPSYVADSLRRTASVEGRCHLRFSIIMSLVVPSTRRSTLGDSAFPMVWSKRGNINTAAPVTIAQCNTLVAWCSRQLIGPADWVFVTLGPLRCD